MTPLFDIMHIREWRLLISRRRFPVKITNSCAIMFSKNRLIAVGFCLLALTACKRNNPIVRPPVAETPRVSTQGPATELENQSTSVPIAVDTLPQPPTSQTEITPSIPPPSKPLASKRSRSTLEPKREASAAAPPESKAVPPPGGIQLTARLNENEKEARIKEIVDELESAKYKLRSIDPAALGEVQKANLMAVQDFIKKSDDLMKRGDLDQSLVLAHKANTLAASLTRTPQ
jgi:type IV secretory pathway VirB10-like protein